MRAFLFAALLVSALFTTCSSTLTVKTKWAVERTYLSLIGETADTFVVTFHNTTNCGLHIGSISRTTGEILWQHEILGDPLYREAPTVSDGTLTPSSVGSGVVVVSMIHRNMPDGCLATSLTALAASDGRTVWSMPAMVASPYSNEAGPFGGSCVYGSTTSSSFLRYSASGVVITSRVCVDDSCRFDGAPDIPTVIIEALQCDASATTACSLKWRWKGDNFTNCAVAGGPTSSCSAIANDLNPNDGNIKVGRVADNNRLYIPSPGMNIGRWPSAPNLFRITFATGHQYKTIGFDASDGTTLCAPDMNRVFYHTTQIGNIQCDVSLPQHDTNALLTRTTEKTAVSATSNSTAKEKRSTGSKPLSYPHGLLQCYQRWHGDSYNFLGDPECGALETGWRKVFSSIGDVDSGLVSWGPVLQGTVGVEGSWIVEGGLHCVTPSGKPPPFPSTIPVGTGQCNIAFVDMKNNKSSGSWAPVTPSGEGVFCTSTKRGSGSCTLVDGTTKAKQPAYEYLPFIAPTILDGGTVVFPNSAVYADGVALIRERSPMGDDVSSAVQNHTLIAYDVKSGKQLYTTTLGWAAASSTSLNWIALRRVTTNNVPAESSVVGLLAASLSVNAAQSVTVVFVARTGAQLWQSKPRNVEANEKFDFDFSRFNSQEFIFLNAEGEQEYCSVQ